jgi:hypothetical protein
VLDWSSLASQKSRMRSFAVSRVEFSEASDGK